jgi:hypothetical protein
MYDLPGPVLVNGILFSLNLMPLYNSAKFQQCIVIFAKPVVFRTMRSRDHDVVVAGRKINLGYWEFGMGREWGGGGKGEVSSRVT